MLCLHVPHRDAPLQILQRPLGVRERPTSEPKTWEQTKEELLNQEKRLEKRKALLKEATRGYFTDLNATRRHGGKTWIAPRVLIREDKALYLPDISGTSLDPEVKGSVHTTSLCTGRVSLVSILSSRISELQSANFTSSTYAEFSAHPRFQHVHINLQENLLKSLLVSLFASGIRRSVPHELWKTYFISRQNMDYVRDAMGLDNRHVGYVYLVDERCRIRWAGCADPMPEEAEALRVCTGVLLSRYDEAGVVKRS
ncbi:hypothetical protein WOLCODRAFT_133830 [Wolfiporia cocos MD-104 SS10]|uniref:F1F0 ATP synthase assembly protein Atp10 n=1 Tax=Wolfiporia cocos (strain MD-104) TaxID=742152 RepID=A0A2H3J036_WOLCO|nr:hypothetical protein WOLCODRAFT_133830 [Wolfiporia cocos MD-104 SS10]